MRPWLAAVLVPGLLVAGCTSDTGAGPPPPAVVLPVRFPDPARGDLPAHQLAALQRVVDTAVSDYALTHAAGARGISVAVVSDRGRWAGVAGSDGHRPLGTRSMFPVADIAHTFLAAEVMLLASRGEVDLDAPLSDHVRDRLTTDGASVRLFLGLRSRSEDPVYDDRSFRLLARLVDEVSGDLADAVRSDLVAPAGLRRIVVGDTRIRSDAATLAAWGYQLYGARVLDAGSVQEMTTESSVLGVAPGIGYGLGTEVFEGLTTDEAVGHLGQDAGHTSMLVVVPARSLALAVQMVGTDRNVTAVARDLLAALE